MPAVSQTSTFRSLLPSPSQTPVSPSSSSISIPNSATTSRASSPAPHGNGNKNVFARRRTRRSEKEIEEEKLRKEFGDEAYRIHNHLKSLSTHLTRIRPAYLAEGTGLPSHRRRRRQLHPSTQATSNAFTLSHSYPPSSATTTSSVSISTTTTAEEQESDSEAEALRLLESLPWLTDSEKDEIELRGKVVLRGCGGRVVLLGKLEQTRQSLHASQHVTPSSLLSTFLPSLATSMSTPPLTTSTNLSTGGPTTESQLSAHHASIILYLNTELLKVSKQLTEMGEERWRRKVEKGRNLGGMIGGETVRKDGAADGRNGTGNSMWDVLKADKGKGKEGQGMETWRGLKLTVPTDPGLAARAAAQSGTGQFTFTTSDDPDGYVPPPLTDAQIQEFSSESSQLLESMSTTLDAALQAEQSLLEISSLQSTLITHLQTQTESINLLYDDAIGTVGEVERANVQLRKAKERGGSARLFLLVFLIGSSMALLFLDYYS